MGNKDKDKEQSSEGALANSALSPWNAHQANRDLSQKREARETALAKQVAEAIAREMAKADMHYQALHNERSAAAMPTSLKVTSGALGPSSTTSCMERNSHWKLTRSHL